MSTLINTLILFVSTVAFFYFTVKYLNGKVR